MYFHRCFLINVFILVKRAEEIAWENFVSAKWGPRSTKKGTRLAGMKLFTCNCRMQFKNSLRHWQDLS